MFFSASLQCQPSSGLYHVQTHVYSRWCTTLLHPLLQHYSCTYQQGKYCTPTLHYQSNLQPHTACTPQDVSACSHQACKVLQSAARMYSSLQSAASLLTGVHESSAVPPAALVSIVPAGQAWHVFSSFAEYSPAGHCKHPMSCQWRHGQYIWMNKVSDGPTPTLCSLTMAASAANIKHMHCS